MLPREITEKNEHLVLASYAAFSDESEGRDIYEEPCTLRTIYQRDRDRIIHSKTFRRLKHKTQVFLSPYGDHYRTRLTHTLEVSQIARTVARALRVNEDLTEAIALAHDIGHTPFGHAGERALTRALGRPFRHNEQSVRVVERLEKEGKGLNLSKEVRDGILCHRSTYRAKTVEGNILRISDKIGYINHDIDDGIRAGILTEDELPKNLTDILGHGTRDRINNIIRDFINYSMTLDLDNDKTIVGLSPEFEEALYDLRKYMFENVYTNPAAKAEEAKAERIVEMLYEYYMDHEDELAPEFIQMLNTGESRDTVVCDYIAGMTDNYAVYKFKEIYIPHSWNVM